MYLSLHECILVYVNTIGFCFNSILPQIPQKTFSPYSKNLQIPCLHLGDYI